MGSRTPRDAYRQIAEALRIEIKALRPSAEPTRLGSEAELASRFEVARNTLRRALAELARDGLVHSVPTKGWFVGRADQSTTKLDQREIAAKLAEGIRNGDPGPGEKLTTAPQIAQRYGVTLHVARQALMTLDAQGLIESRHGKGWFVRTPNA